VLWWDESYGYGGNCCAIWWRGARFGYSWVSFRLIRDIWREWRRLFGLLASLAFWLRRCSYIYCMSAFLCVSLFHGLHARSWRYVISASVAATNLLRKRVLSYAYNHVYPNDSKMARPGSNGFKFFPFYVPS
jgi:hypothetical protein